VMRVAIALLLFLLFPCATSAQAESRIALLIANQAYSKEIGQLTNPYNDAALLERTLKGLGFEVAVERDASLGALTRAVNAYARRVREAGPSAVGFFYYSGHGAADAGMNYLIPTDVKTTETSELWDQSLRLTEITRKLKTEAANATHFVVFDACRNSLKLTKKGSRALAQSKGFVPVVQESGMLIAYATAEGELASDVGVEAGPYARVLAEEIVKPGVEAVTMFRRVQVRVRSAIGQEPWLGFSALSEVHFAGLNLEKDPYKSTPQASEAERAWEWVKDTTNQAVLENFIKQFSNTEYSDRARSRLGELKKQEQVAREEAKRKLETEAEKKRLADEAERKRLAALKSEEDRRLEAEARARAREEAERKRLASLKTEDDRKKEAIGSKSVSNDTLVLELSSGKVVIRLRPDLAPKHVEQIKRLTAEGFYNGIVFHRVIAGFMAQTGDPTATGTGGSKLPNLPAEFTQEEYKRGSVGMARTTDPNSANSQFFICFGTTCRPLTGQYTLWGEVIEGMENVDKIAKGEPPPKPDKIVRATIVSK